MAAITFRSGDLSWTKEELSKKLETLASSLPGDKVFWSEKHSGAAVQKEILNALQFQILATDDKELVAIFKRAVRNHDALNKQEAAKPVLSYNKHHPDLSFKIPDTHITLDVREDCVHVTTYLLIQRESASSKLILNGQGHRVNSVEIDDIELSQSDYKVTAYELILNKIPKADYFRVKISSIIDPFTNQSCQGLYRSGNLLTTQCESEGAQHIFYTLDRPDNLSSYTVEIIADSNKYPHRISNGNLISETVAEDGRAVVLWEDPFPKPCYLFACVLGDFDLIEGTYTIEPGQEVKLQVFVEKGKRERGEYALWALQKSMAYDQEFFDRKYDLTTLKVVGVPDFNMGAMENKGLLIFNDRALLVSQKSGLDRTFRRVAGIIFHEYAHNWSGNRVTVKNWFELPLKEAFTDFRTTLFKEAFFTQEIDRIEQIQILRECQFPEDASALAHPLQVESYTTSDEIYDDTTYVKGREVFRMLQTILGDKFREAQNAYFSRYDGQAVTFKELLSTLEEVGQIDLTVFKRWFHQPGTPEVSFKMTYNPIAGTAVLQVNQTCFHPKTGVAQEPFHIPLYLELMSSKGDKIIPKKLFHFKEHEEIYVFEDVKEEPILLFLHGLSAPVKWKYSFKDKELAAIILHSDDPFWRYEAGNLYAKRRLGELIQGTASLSQDTISFYEVVIKSDRLSPYAKAQVLELPTLRTLAIEAQCYDYPLVFQALKSFKTQLGKGLEKTLQKLLDRYPHAASYNPYGETFVEEMKVRALRNTILSYLVAADEQQYATLAVEQYLSADNFNDERSALGILANSSYANRFTVLQDFYEKWKGDKGVFNEWIQAISGSQTSTIDLLKEIQSKEGYDPKNPNHLRSVFLTFVNNLAAFHDSKGLGYQYITSMIIEIASYNNHVAATIAKDAFIDYPNLPIEQKKLMRCELLLIKEAQGLHPSLRQMASDYLGE